MNPISRSEVYREQYAHFRSMNEILYKMPPIFTAVIGGLWYFAASNIDKDKLISCSVFIFSALVSLCFVNVMQRFRKAFSAYINNLNKLDGDLAVSIPAGIFPSTAKTIQWLLAAACIISFLGAWYVYHKC